MDTIEPRVAADTTPAAHTAVANESHAQSTVTPDAAAGAAKRPAVVEWLVHDILFIAMLLLALVGVVFRLAVTYWVLLTPVFAVISIAEGWKHFVSRKARLGLVYRVALDWGALLLAILLLYNSGVRGVMNANATSLAMVTLLALGTFVAGVQARVWQICAVGGALFLAVPSLGWLDQSPLLLAFGACIIIGLSGLAWWVSQGRSTKQISAPLVPAAPPV